MSDERSLMLYTIGHSNLPLADFLANLQRHGVTVLVDVRSAPYSQYVPHFNKNRLQTALQEHGVAYHFAGEYLGGRPKDPSLYQDDPHPGETGSRAEVPRRIQYETMVQREAYQQGIRRLLEIVQDAMARGENVAIMCSEGDPHKCHRHFLIARSLADPAAKIVDVHIEVIHILRDGAVEMFAPDGYGGAR